MIGDISDSMEEQISEKMRAEFKYEIALMKSDMIAKIVSAWGGIPRHVGTKYGYEEVGKDFEVTRSRGEDRICWNMIEKIIVEEWWRW